MHGVINAIIWANEKVSHPKFWGGSLFLSKCDNPEQSGQVLIIEKLDNNPLVRDV
jgi:hypothetical protein